MEVDIIKHEIVYDGFFRLEKFHLRHSLYAGGWSESMVREILERGHAVAVLPYDPVQDAVVMIEQFRIGALDTENAWLLEIIAGMIEQGEEAREVAYREAQEEAGCQIQALEHIYEYHVSPGGSSERIILFCGKVDARGIGGIHGLASEHEDIKVTVMPTDEALNLLHNAQIRSATPIIALQWLAANRKRLRTAWG